MEIKGYNNIPYIYINFSDIYIYIYIFYLLVSPGVSVFLFAVEVKLCSSDPNEVNLSPLFLPPRHWQWCGAYQYHSSNNLSPPFLAANANPMIPPVSFVGDLEGSAVHCSAPQCTVERQLLLMDHRSFPQLSKAGCIPQLCSAVRPNQEYAMETNSPKPPS